MKEVVLGCDGIKRVWQLIPFSRLTGIKIKKWPELYKGSRESMVWVVTGVEQ